MKFASALPFVAGLGFVTANPLIQKRAATSDKATIGYATLSGGQVLHSLIFQTKINFFEYRTTGGGSAAPITVTTLDELKAAVAGVTAKVIMVSGSITGNQVVEIGSNTSLLGNPGSTLNGVGLRVMDSSNVIIRNLKITKVLAEVGDHIGIQASNRVWVDSVEIWSDRDHDKDYYDGLLDLTHGVYATSITNSYLYDHWKGSLVGHSDSNGDEDVAIQVTYAFNKWYNLNSRTPSFRFGHGHIFNNYFLSNNDGINCRMGAELTVQNNVFESVQKPIYTTDGCTLYASGNDCGGASCTSIPPGTVHPLGYSYTLTATSGVKAYVDARAGAELTWS